MSFELVLELKCVSGSPIKLDAAISCHCQCLSISGKGMVRDWMVEQMVNFWGCHSVALLLCDRSSSLLSLGLDAKVEKGMLTTLEFRTWRGCCLRMAGLRNLGGNLGEDHNENK
jgi:hypothetical protein